MPLPNWLWKLTLALLVLTLGSAAALLLALSLGWNPPHPAAQPPHTLSAPLSLEVVAPEQQALQLLERAAPPFTLEARVQPAGGSELTASGLVFQARDDRHYTVFAVGMDGYLAVLQVDDTTPTPLLDWQQFPHIRRGPSANRLRLSCSGQRCQFWVNDEYVTALDSPPGSGDGVGLWLQRAGGAYARATFDPIVLWQTQ